MQVVIDNNEYSTSGKLDVFSQMHLVRKLGAALPVLEGMTDTRNASKDKTLLTVLMLANISDADSEFVVKKCLSVVTRKQGSSFAKLQTPDGHMMFDDISLSAILIKPIKESRLIKILNQILATDNQQLNTESPQQGILLDSFAKDYPLDILIAEDNMINQKLVVSILQKLGYNTALAVNGNQVLQAIKIQEYNVILMDIQMPEMDGFEATRIIRQMDIHQPYIIALTANAMAGDRDECIRIGMDNYIAKPMRLPEIIKILKIASEKFRRERII